MDSSQLNVRSCDLDEGDFAIATEKEVGIWAILHRLKKQVNRGTNAGVHHELGLWLS